MFEFLDDKEFAIEMRLESARVILQIQAEEIDVLTKQLKYMQSNNGRPTSCNTLSYDHSEYWDKGGI